MCAMKVNWSDLDVSAGSSQWLVSSSRKFDSPSAYKYVTSLTFQIDITSDDLKLLYYGPKNISSKSLRHILSLYRDVDDTNIVIDWTGVPSIDLESILVETSYHQQEVDDESISTDEEGDGGESPEERGNDGFQLLSSSAEWGEIFANEKEQRINIAFPDGRPTFRGLRLNNAKANPPEICIK